MRRTEAPAARRAAASESDRPCARTPLSSAPAATTLRPRTSIIERSTSSLIDPGELEEHYRARTTLRVNVLPGDMAQAVLLLNVDGGVPAALAR